MDTFECLKSELEVGQMGHFCPDFRHCLKSGHPSWDLDQPERLKSGHAEIRTSVCPDFLRSDFGALLYLYVGHFPLKQISLLLKLTLYPK